MVKAIIIGVNSTVLSAEEREIFKSMDPLGFILFRRNLESGPQLKNLIKDLRSISGRKNVPIFIDQEGGRVQRIGNNFGVHQYPPAQLSGDLAKTGLNLASDLCRINYSAIGSELSNLGINVNCAPCVDLSYEHTHKVIGDRSFSRDPKIVSKLGQAAIYGLKETGVMAVIKHIPGHGRANLDSHLALPIVDSSIEELAEDFLPFKELAHHIEIAMTAHIIFKAIDPENPATLSKKVINYIRNEMNFSDKILISDDIGMKALSGTAKDIALKVLEAGCDLVLHCNGNIDEIRSLNELDLPINNRVREVFLDEKNPFVKIEEQKDTSFNLELNIAQLRKDTHFEYQV